MVSKKKKIEKSLKNEIKTYDDFLDGTKEYVNLVPFVQERKKEAIARLTFVQYAPDDVLSEYYDQLYGIQISNEEESKRLIPPFPLPSGTAKYIFGGTATTGSYSEIFFNVSNFNTNEVDEKWITPIKEVFSNLSEEKSRKDNLPKYLEKIQIKLGEMFQIAINSVEKSRTGVLGVDQAAKQLRDVIKQLWGGIAELARNKGPNQYKKIRLELSRIKSRDIVVECLAKDTITGQKMTLLLQGMATIHAELSAGEFSKNPLTNDLERLNSLYSMWIILIDDIVGFINVNVGLDD